MCTPTTRRNCRQLVANSCLHRRRDATRQFRLVGGVYWALVGIARRLHVHVSLSGQFGRQTHIAYESSVLLRRALAGGPGNPSFLGELTTANVYEIDRVSDLLPTKSSTYSYVVMSLMKSSVYVVGGVSDCRHSCRFFFGNRNFPVPIHARVNDVVHHYPINKCDLCIHSTTFGPIPFHG